MKQTTTLPQFCLAAILTLAASPVLLAQQPAAETIQQRIITPSSSSTVPAAPPSASNTDLGQISVVQTYPKPEMFTLSTSQQFFYTDNVFYTSQHLSTLTGQGTVGSYAYLGSYTGSIVPYALRDWTPRITLQYNQVRYDDAASGDFDNKNAAISSQYVFGDDRSWTWNSSVNVGQFTDPHVNDHQFYAEIVYDNQISNVMPLGKDNQLFLLNSYDIAYHQANPGIFDRLDNTLSSSLIYYPFPELSISGYVRPGARIYTTNGALYPGIYQNDRDDFNLAVGVDVTWTPWKYVSFSADFNHVNDYSNNSLLGYSESSPGISVTGTVKW